MNLGEIRYLVASWTDDSYEFKCQAFTHPHSYRGYYYELAFEPSNEPLTVVDVTKSICEAYTETFTGWKGGEYKYDDSTPVHLSFEGESSDEEGCDFTELLFAMDREYRSFNSNMCYNKHMETNTASKAKRKTAAEKREEARLAREEQERVETEQFKTTYQTRLLKLVHAYMSELSHSLKVTGESEYSVFEFVTSRYNTLRLPLLLETDPQPVLHVRDDMEEAERFLETNREAQRVERERAEKKATALAKLTKEERELLGV